MKKKIALITGITGQDGSYLAEFLLNKNYFVHGLKRKSSSFNTHRIDHIYENKEYKKRFKLHYGDMTDALSIFNLIKKIKPDEVYNLAAQSHVATSFEIPDYTSDVNALGTLRVLEAIRKLNLSKKHCKNFKTFIFGNNYKEFKKNIKNKINLKHFKSLKDILDEIFFDLNDKKLKKKYNFL